MWCEVFLGNHTLMNVNSQNVSTSMHSAWPEHITTQEPRSSELRWQGQLTMPLTITITNKCLWNSPWQHFWWLWWILVNSLDLVKCGFCLISWTVQRWWNLTCVYVKRLFGLKENKKIAFDAKGRLWNKVFGKWCVISGWVMLSHISSMCYVKACKSCHSPPRGLIAEGSN